MADAGFFRGTSAAQDNRFSDKEKKMMKQMKFSDSLVKKVDMPRVKLDVIKPWIARRVTEMLGAEDEVLVEFVFNQLEEKNLNPRKMQINLTGFLNGKNARVFMQELWDLLCSASTNPNGIPDSFIEEKKEQIKKRNEEEARQEQMIRRQLEAERQRVERQLSCPVRHSPPDHRTRSPEREERRQRRRSREETGDDPAEPAPAPDRDGHRREPSSEPAAAGRDQTANNDRGHRDPAAVTETRRPERAVTDKERLRVDNDVDGKAERKRGSRYSKQDSYDADRKTSRSRHSRSQPGESRWNSRSDDERSRSRSRERYRSRSRSWERRRSRSRSRDRHRSRSRSWEPRRSRSRSRENRRESEKQSRRKQSSSGRSSPRLRRSPRPRSSSREPRRAEKKQVKRSAASAADRSVSPPDRSVKKKSRPDTRRLTEEDGGSKSSKKKRRAASDDESDLDKKKGKKKKKKKHSKKHKKHKSRKRSGSMSKEKEAEKESEDKKDTSSQVTAAAAAASPENDEPPLWRDESGVRPNNIARNSEDNVGDVHSSDNDSSGDAESALELRDDDCSLLAEDSAASSTRGGEDRVSPEESEDNSFSDEEEEEQDMEALEMRLRERALRSMRRRQELKAVTPPAPRDGRSRSCPGSGDSE